MAVVYILLSIPKQMYYIGCTDNIERRISEHNLGKVRSTKGLRPLELKLAQSYTTLSEARRIESRLKKLKRKDIIEKIIQEKHIRMDP